MLNTSAFTSVSSRVLKLFQMYTSQIETNAVSSGSEFVLPDREIILFGQIANGWKIIHPLAVMIEQFDDLFVASEDIFGIYGDGDTEYEAIEDYKSSLLDYYQLIEHHALDDEQDRIVFNHLRLYISPAE